MIREGGEGTLKYKSDRRRRVAMIVLSIAIAFVAAGTIIFADRVDRSGGGLSPALAVGLALAFVAGMIAANWVYLRNVDELEWANNVSATFWGMMVLGVLYPTWLILWFGNLVPEPDAEGLYIITFLSAGVVYLWRRFR
jgi:putative flippase GtrA